MIATSENDVWPAAEFPGCLFKPKYRGKSFVVYNLKYDQGAFIQGITRPRLQVLRQRGWCFYKGYKYTIIGYKCLTIRRGKNSIHIYDMFNFYGVSLNEAAKTFLGEKKNVIETKDFWPFYVIQFWSKIAEYCCHDAWLVSRLAEVLIKRFEKYGVYPKKLYSVAYISYQYFKQNTPYVTVKRFWKDYPMLIQFALEAYNGGKFEVTEKGIDYYYEYDIVSAYPFEISNLINIRWARVLYQKTYRKDAVYGFIRCIITIPHDVFSPCPVKRRGLNTYPVGTFERTITKAEYEYLISVGCDVKIKEGYWLCLDNKQYPYRAEVQKLTKLKAQYKREGKDFDYHTVKIFLNSLYGKFVQLIEKEGHYEATSCWMPIYGSVITANCRIRMSTMQQKYNSVVATHTDSIISTERLPYGQDDGLGKLAYETEGEGIILGSGIYQIGDKVKFRGFPLKTNLLDFVHKDSKTITLSTRNAFTWKSVIHRGLPLEMINRFEIMDKKVTVNFDHKRLWLNDWKKFKDIENRKVFSIPLTYSELCY